MLCSLDILLFKLKLVKCKINQSKIKKYIDQMIKWFYCILPHTVPGLGYRQDDSGFSFSHRFTFGRLKAGSGSVAAVMLSHIVLFFFRDPRNENLSSVILISTVLH